MNKSRILIIVAGVVIIVAFSLYTFGSNSTEPKAGTKANPVNSVAQVGSGGPASSTASTFVNRENPGNFYSIQFPTKASVEHGNGSGSYIAKLPQGVFSVQLVDIPDTSDVQLILLTQIQPALKSSLQDFNRVGYNQYTVGGHRVWDLTYTWKNATVGMESIKSIVEGSDHAAAITFSGARQMFGDRNTNSTVIRPVVESFHWIGQ
jgi:hypothetical protein